MSLLLELAGNKAKARAAAKDLTVAQLENLIAGFNNALEKLKEEAAVLAAQDAEKTQKAAEIADMIAKSGLTMDEIAAFSMPRAIATKGKTVEPKYRIEVAGEVCEWTGRGRTPKVFQQYFDAGNSKESCLIK